MRNPNEVYADGSVDVEGNQVSAHLENDSATPTSGLSDRITESSTQPSTGAMSSAFRPWLTAKLSMRFPVPMFRHDKLGLTDLVCTESQQATAASGFADSLSFPDRLVRLRLGKFGDQSHVISVQCVKPNYAVACLSGLDRQERSGTPHARLTMLAAGTDASRLLYSPSHARQR